MTRAKDTGILQEMEKQTMFTKIYETARKRIYRSDIPISKGKFEDIEPTMYVSISDAWDHPERLAFAVYLADGCRESDLGKKPHTLRINMLHIAGRHFPLDGTGVVPSDRELLEEVARRNGLEFWLGSNQ